jgi:LPXTG-site transpeptidase (sortase) family protein
MSRVMGLAASALVGAIAVAPLVASAAAPPRPGPVVAADGRSVPSGSVSSTGPAVVSPALPKFVQAPVTIINPLEAHKVRDPSAGRPVRVSIPSLGVTAPVIPIAAAAGTLEPPNDPYVWGWWNDGADAGAAVGSALITGHTVHNGPAPMNNLDTIKLGAKVNVTTTQGGIPYRVIMVRIFRKASLARSAGTVFSQTVPGRLVLVTCDDWNGTEYLSNAVVIAVPARSR